VEYFKSQPWKQLDATNAATGEDTGFGRPASA